MENAFDHWEKYFNGIYFQSYWATFEMKWFFLTIIEFSEISILHLFNLLCVLVYVIISVKKIVKSFALVRQLEISF